MPEIRLVNSERIKPKLTAAQERAIKKIYKDSLKSVREWAKFLEGKSNVSSILRTQYLNNMEREIQQEFQKIGESIEETIRYNILEVSKTVVDDANSALDNIGLHIKGAYSFVPANVVQAITTGQVYDGNWSLSKSIWQHTKKSQQEIHDIIAKGVLENKSSYDIAKELEKYVDPSARKPWDWGKIYPGVSKVVDYNAQRLARTLVSHAYQQSFIETTKDNPFFEGYRWLAANNHRVCEVCRGYAENQHAEGLPEGVFPKGELPLDHPNGQCTHSVFMTKEITDITDSLVSWAYGESNEELDRFAKSLGYPIEEVKESAKEYKYHATKLSSIAGIIEKGLKPNKGHFGKAVYLANSPGDAIEWTTTTSTGGNKVLRVTKSFLNTLGYEEYSASESGYDLAEGLAYGTIPWKELQIQYGDEWVSLSEYASQMKNLVYNKLSPSAKKKVDKELDIIWKEKLEEYNKKHK